MHFSWNQKEGRLRSLFAPLIFFLVLLVFMAFGTGLVSRKSGEEQTKILTDAVNRAVVQCYATEGAYPPNIAYLEEHYGLLVDHTNYIVHYEAFASNIYPTVLVLPVNP